MRRKKQTYILFLSLSSTLSLTHKDTHTKHTGNQSRIHTTQRQTDTMPWACQPVKDHRMCNPHAWHAEQFQESDHFNTGLVHIDTSALKNKYH